MAPRISLGVTAEKHAEMLAAQDGKCAICGATESHKQGKAVALAVDHNHKTGELRDLICLNCNLALGRFEDDPKRLRAAAAYLREARDA